MMEVENMWNKLEEYIDKLRIYTYKKIEEGLSDIYKRYNISKEKQGAIEVRVGIKDYTGYISSKRVTKDVKVDIVLSKEARRSKLYKKIEYGNGGYAVDAKRYLRSYLVDDAEVNIRSYEELILVLNKIKYVYESTIYSNRVDMYMYKKRKTEDKDVKNPIHDLKMLNTKKELEGVTTKEEKRLELLLPEVDYDGCDKSIEELEGELNKLVVELSRYMNKKIVKNLRKVYDVRGAKELLKGKLVLSYGAKDRNEYIKITSERCMCDDYDSSLGISSVVNNYSERVGDMVLNGVIDEDIWGIYTRLYGYNLTAMEGIIEKALKEIIAEGEKDGINQKITV